jgi:hypothetical protein
MVGWLMKLQHWEYAGFVLEFGVIGFALVYITDFMLGEIERKKNKDNPKV